MGTIVYSVMLGLHHQPCDCVKEVFRVPGFDTPPFLSEWQAVHLVRTSLNVGSSKNNTYTSLGIPYLYYGITYPPPKKKKPSLIIKAPTSPQSKVSLGRAGESARLWASGLGFRVTIIVVLLIVEILHDLKDPILWKLWYSPYYG